MLETKNANCQSKNLNNFSAKMFFGI